MSLFESIVRTVDTTDEPVTLAEAKEHLRYDGSTENDYITALISAARDYVESYTGRYWALATFDIYYTRFPVGNEPLDLRIPDISAINSLTYLDGNQETQTISTGYTLDTGRRSLRYNDNWPLAVYGVKINADIGIDNGSSPAELLPQAIKQGILLVIADLFNNRSSVTYMQTYKNKAVDMMIFPYRVRMGI